MVLLDPKYDEIDRIRMNPSQVIAARDNIVNSQEFASLILTRHPSPHCYFRVHCCANLSR
jgi:hypothetical protein